MAGTGFQGPAGARADAQVWDARKPRLGLLACPEGAPGGLRRGPADRRGRPAVAGGSRRAACRAPRALYLHVALRGMKPAGGDVAL